VHVQFPSNSRGNPSSSMLIQDLLGLVFKELKTLSTNFERACEVKMRENLMVSPQCSHDPLPMGAPTISPAGSLKTRAIRFNAAGLY